MEVRWSSEAADDLAAFVAHIWAIRPLRNEPPGIFSNALERLRPFRIVAGKAV